MTNRSLGNFSEYGLKGVSTKLPNAFSTSFTPNIKGIKEQFEEKSQKAYEQTKKLKENYKPDLELNPEDSINLE